MHIWKQRIWIKTKKKGVYHDCMTAKVSSLWSGRRSDANPRSQNWRVSPFCMMLEALQLSDSTAHVHGGEELPKETWNSCCPQFVLWLHPSSAFASIAIFLISPTLKWSYGIGGTVKDGWEMFERVLTVWEPAILGVLIHRMCSCADVFNWNSRRR